MVYKETMLFQKGSGALRAPPEADLPEETIFFLSWGQII